MSQFVVGLTGGIGSGKTAVSDRFAQLGIAVVDADLASRAVVEPGRPALDAVREHFGDAVIAADGSLDRKALGAIVFADPGERRRLEQITHPYINEYLANALASADSPYAILAHPLLIETSQARVCQRVLVVDVPEALQIERTVARDGREESQVREILAAQASREQRLTAADDVIVNDQDLAHLDREVARLHEQYLAMATAASA
jgi:dephospho-CoA kinase